MPVTLEKLIQYSDNSNATETLSYGDFEITVKTDLTITEKQQFIESVVESAYINNIIPSGLNTDIALAITFLNMCTDIPLPTKELGGETVIDSQASYNIYKSLRIAEKCKMASDFICEMQRYIDARIEFENRRLIAYFSAPTATSDAITTFSNSMNKLADLLDIAAVQLEKNGNKLSKQLTPKKINEWINGIQKSFVNSAVSNEKAVNSEEG